MLSEAERVLVVSHQDPDGDALGSSLGLMHLLAADKEVFVHSAGPIAGEYDFLPGRDRISPELPPAAEIDLAVLLDCHEPSRAGEAAEELLPQVPKTIIVDHHQGVPKFGQVRWVDPDYSATSEMLVEMAEKTDLPLNPQAATCLFVGLQTDTGSFRYGNTTSRILRIAADLVDNGADPWAISQEVYATQPKRMMLWASIINNLSYLAGGRLAVAQVLQDDLSAAGCGPQDLEQVVETIRSIHGVEVAVLLREMDGGGVKVSLRSRGRVDVAQVAQQMGGGGHRNAAGLRLRQDISSVRRQMIQSLTDKLEAAT
jgi:phosphoesterase RecJ-like protein